MNVFALTLAFLKNRPLATGLNITLFALAVAVLVILAKVEHHAQNRLMRDAAGIDMVVGAKGSPLQLIMASIYHVDTPTGNIPLTAQKQIADMPQVKRAIPLSMGDSYHGFRIIGSSTDILDLYQTTLFDGHSWTAPMQAVIGADVAARTKLEVGSTFSGSHGLVSADSAQQAHVHEDAPYTVVGILAPTHTTADRLIFTDTASVWHVHGQHHHHHDDDHHDHEHDNHHHAPLEITALLVQLTTPMAAIGLPREINNNTAYQAALPATEMARLIKLMDFGVRTFHAFALLLLGISALSLFVMLIQAMQQRKFDLAVMRTLGASRLRVSIQILAESFAISMLGLLIGFMLGYGLLAYLAATGTSLYLHGLNVWHIVPLEYVLLALVIIITLLAAAIPTWQAYRTHVSNLLLRGQNL